MNNEELLAEISKLRQEIEKHDMLYYELANPLLTDYEYDQLVTRLKHLETLLPPSAKDCIPSPKVGSDLSSGAKVKAHIQRMYSLDNAYSLEELRAYLQKLASDIGSFPETHLEHKIDGFSINLFYDKGNLIYATTRGDGFEGEDVTTNIRTLSQIPSHIEFQKAIEIRGEVYIPLQEFLELNETRRQNDDKIFANPRNAAAGSIKLKNPEEVKTRSLRALFYSIGYCEKLLVETQADLISFLTDMGFPTSPDSIVALDFTAIEQYCRYWEEHRYAIAYDIDGIVVKANSIAIQQSLGFTNKSPKWAIAYKFKPEVKETKLLEVQYQVGRTGAITPVASLDPVYISGSTVSRCTLHNEEEIKRLDLHIGDTVKVIKSGEIIPKIIEVVTQLRDPDSVPVSFTEVCPECNSKLYRNEDSPISYCTNTNCPAQIQRQLEHFCSRDAMDIYGLGESLISRFVELGLIKRIQDIYELDYQSIAGLDRLGEKSAQNLKTAVEASKTKNFDKVIFALGIRYVGEKTARTLASFFGNIDAMMLADIETLKSVPDIGDIVAASVYSYMNNDSNKVLIADLRKIGLTFTFKSDQVSEALSNKTFLVTGTLPTLGRKETEALVLKHGGKIVSSVSKNLDFLIVGDNPGSKLGKAQKLGSVTIINEDEFMSMIEGNS